LFFNVGTLYDCQTFLNFVNEHLESPFSAKSILEGYGSRYKIAPTKDMMKVSYDSNWLRGNIGDIEEGLRLEITDKGKKICKQRDAVSKLRLQLKDIIIQRKPPWLQSIKYGRDIFTNELRRDPVSQCLRDACLLEGDDDTIVSWWDELSNLSRGIERDHLLEIGRTAEKKSIIYETKRTGVRPKWEAIDSNKSGFDLLSKISESNKNELFIEVKGTSYNLENKNSEQFAFIHISRNEWNIANSPAEYIFHIWISLNSKNEKLIKLYPGDIQKHIPQDNNKGKWESVKIPVKELLKNE